MDTAPLKGYLSFDQSAYFHESMYSCAKWGALLFSVDFFLEFKRCCDLLGTILVVKKRL